MSRMHVGGLVLGIPIILFELISGLPCMVFFNFLVAMKLRYEIACEATFMLLVTVRFLDWPS